MTKLSYKANKKRRVQMVKIILDLCGGTGAWSKPYRDNGYDVRVLTLPDFNVNSWRDDKEFVELLHSNTVYGILAAPPCTMFSIARNDTTAIKTRDLRGGDGNTTSLFRYYSRDFIRTI